MYKAIIFLLLFSACRATEFRRVNTNIHKKGFEHCSFVLDEIKENIFYNKKYKYYVTDDILLGNRSKEYLDCMMQLTRSDILQIFGKPYKELENQFNYLISKRKGEYTTVHCHDLIFYFERDRLTGFTEGKDNSSAESNSNKALKIKFLFFKSNPVRRIKPARLDYSFLPNDCQLVIKEMHKYVLINKKTKRFIMPYYTALDELKTRYGGMSACVTQLTPAHIRDIFGTPTYEDNTGLYYLANDKKDVNFNQYYYCYFSLGENGKIKEQTWAYRDTK
jgi:uncharacterized protein (DUF1810 family)